MTEKTESHLNIGVLSHPGEKREINEDSFGVSSYIQESDLTPVVLAIVADGIGGHQAGEIASQLTVDTIMNKLTKEEIVEPLHQLRTAVKSAGSIVSETSLRSSEYYGMGSTVAIAWVIDNKLYTAHVGDSRIYFLRDSSLTQISIDHTWVQEALRHEIITPEEAKNHPRAHVLQLAIGSQDPPEPDFRLHLSAQETDMDSENNQGLPLLREDKILLCSDGLTDLVEDHEIQAALEEQNPDDAAQSLVSLARARGGHDNITVAILAVPDDWPEVAIPVKTNKKTLLRIVLIAVILAAITIALVLNAWLGIFRWPWSVSSTPLPMDSLSSPQSSTQPELLPSTVTISPSGVNQTVLPEITTTPAPTATAIPLPTVGSSDPTAGANPGGSTNPGTIPSATTKSSSTVTDTPTYSPEDLLTLMPTTLPLPTIDPPGL
jgi:protein phosphatase